MWYYAKPQKEQHSQSQTAISSTLCGSQLRVPAGECLPDSDQNEEEDQEEFGHKRGHPDFEDELRDQGQADDLTHVGDEEVRLRLDVHEGGVKRRTRNEQPSNRVRDESRGPQSD